MSVSLFQGDNVEVMHREIADNSIQLTVTSPPYDNLRKYNGFTWDFESVARELYRVTKPGGVVVWVVNDATVSGGESLTSFKQAIGFCDAGFRLYDTMIWRKPSPSCPTEGRYYSVFEYMFVFSKGRPSVLNLLTDRPNKSAGAVSTRETRSCAEDRKNTGRKRVVKEFSRRFNVWDVSTDSKGAGHPAVFPEALAEGHILSWSNPGDIVLDPFLGSGTTGVACVNTGRNFIGIEKDAEYFNVAQWRIAMAQAERLMSA